MGAFTTVHSYGCAYIDLRMYLYYNSYYDELMQLAICNTLIHCSLSYVNYVAIAIAI